jgi:cytochrome P450
MLDCWVEEDATGVTSVTTDTSTLALHVITCAGFGISYHFRSGLDAVREGFSMSYADSLYSVMKNLLLLILVPSWTYSSPILPKALTEFKVAVTDFKRYMIEMVELAKTRTADSEFIQPNLLNTLVQKSKEVLLDSGGRDSLSDDEIYGNLFIFSFAGHETTANTLSFSIYLLAAFPEYQEWVGQELDEVLKDHERVETIDYEQVYPELKRCLALMVINSRLCYSKQTKRRFTDAK